MNEWQKRFLQRLENARRQWLDRFEEAADDALDPVVARLEAFLSTHGFEVSQHECEPGTRIFRFGLTENGYTLFTCRLKGMERVELRCESFVPGAEALSDDSSQVLLCDADESWFEDRFQAGLDAFMSAFVEAGASSEKPRKQLQPT